MEIRRRGVVLGGRDQEAGASAGRSRHLAQRARPATGVGAVIIGEVRGGIKAAIKGLARIGAESDPGYALSRNVMKS